MRQALTLSAALAAVLVSTAFYANNVRAPIDARAPSASLGSITLAVDTAAAARTVRKLKTAIVWTNAREVS